MMQSVQVIIERLKSHPEDFFGDFEKHLARSPKFIDITEKLDDLLLEKNDHPQRLWYLEPEEKEALLAAYKEARRARFEARIFHTLLTAPTSVDLAVERMSSSGKRLMSDWSDARGMWQGAVPKAEGQPVMPRTMAELAEQIEQAKIENAHAENRNARP